MTNVPGPYVPLVHQAAAGTGLPPEVVAAQANMESGFNARATSPTGAQGWLQFEPSTWAAQHVPGSPYDPRAATQGYIKLMGTLLRQYGGNMRNALAAYNAGPGNIGAGFGYADKILAAAGLSGGANAAPSRPVVPNIVPGVRIPSQIGGGLDAKALAEAVLKREVQTPINVSGKVTAGRNAFNDYVSAARSGQFNAPTQNVTDTLQSTQSAGSLRTTGLAPLQRGGNLNPLGHPGWNIGRTDMGVDANATPGTPIEAINDSKVVQIVPNWFRGQPLVLMQLTAGPDAGKYWYVSEQIAQTPHVGQTIQRGQTVAVYAPSGTGIEIGWGDPNTASRTAAGPHYTEGAVTPEGRNFLHHVLGR